MSNTASILSLGGPLPSVQYIGGNIDFTQNGGGLNLDLSSIDIQSGDLIIGVHAVGEDSNLLSSMNIASTGYTLIASLFGSDTYDVNLEVYAKIADGTETLFTTSAGLLSTSSVFAIARVYRGPSSIPTGGPGLYVADTANNTDDITWPTVIGTKTGDMLVYIGATGHVSAVDSDYTNSSDLTDFVSDSASDSEDITVGIGNKAITSESSFSASDWNMTGNTTSSAVAYVILKLSV